MPERITYAIVNIELDTDKFVALMRELTAETRRLAPRVTRAGSAMRKLARAMDRELPERTQMHTAYDRRRRARVRRKRNHA